MCASPRCTPCGAGLPQPARSATAFSTARCLGCLVISARRNSSASLPAACASSSMKHSRKIAFWLMFTPRQNTHVPPGFWRGVNINQNAIFLECFMDELALAAGQDALEFRRKLMTKHPKHLAVLNAVADRAGWGKPAPQGVHRGLAHMMAFGSYVAACAEVSVTGGDKVKVRRIVCATDPGHAVNPAQIERQIAGSFVYGLSAVFMEECTVKDGAIEQTNFNTFDSMKIAQMPKVESVIMPSGGSWGGVGEPTICVAAPAVLNAMFRATGKRIRTFPLKNHGYQIV